MKNDAGLRGGLIRFAPVMAVVNACSIAVGVLSPVSGVRVLSDAEEHASVGGIECSKCCRTAGEECFNCVAPTNCTGYAITVNIPGGGTATTNGCKPNGGETIPVVGQKVRGIAWSGRDGCTEDGELKTCKLLFLQLNKNCAAEGATACGFQNLRSCGMNGTFGPPPASIPICIGSCVEGTPCRTCDGDNCT
jgi:hypothetical protein